MDTKLTPKNGNVNPIDKKTSSAEIILTQIERYNQKDCNRYNQFLIGDGIAVEALLNLHQTTHELFLHASSGSFSKVLYSLLKSVILQRPDYSTDVSTKEDNTRSREVWEGPAKIELNTDAVADLFFDIELITNYLSAMEGEADRIESLVNRYKIESLEKEQF